MAIYTKVDLQQLNELANRFDIEVTGSRAMELGSTNSNYVLDTPSGEKYLLSIAEELSRQQVEEGGRLLSWLEEHDFCSSRPIKTVEGAWSETYQGKPVTLRTWIEGRVELDLSEDMLAAVGKRMALLHRIPKPDYLTEDHMYDDPEFGEPIGSDSDPDFERWLERRLEVLKSELDPDLPKGLIHGDLFADNIIFDRRSLVAFIDFEMACDHFLVYEIGMALVGLCATDNQLDLAKVNALVQAYLLFGDLDETECASLQGFAELAAVQTANWRFWKYHFAQPSPENSAKHLEMQALADDIRQVPNGAFIDAILTN